MYGEEFVFVNKPHRRISKNEFFFDENNIYKYEDFTTENCVFENQFSISIGGSGRLVPKNYKDIVRMDV